MNTLNFIASLIFGLLTSLFWLRVIFQWKQVSFINPVSQTVYHCTQPLVGTLQFILPKTRFNWAAVFVTFAIQLCFFVVLYSFIDNVPMSQPGYWPALSIEAAFGSLNVLLEVFFYMLIFVLIGSWVPQLMRSSAGQIIGKICNPVIARVDSLVPPIPPLSFGVLILLLLLQLAKMVLLDIKP